MKEKLRKDKNMLIFLGILLTLQCLSRFSIDGLSTLTIFSGIVGILAFLIAFKTHKDSIKNDKDWFNEQLL